MGKEEECSGNRISGFVRCFTGYLWILFEGQRPELQGEAVKSISFAVFRESRASETISLQKKD